MKKIIFSKGFSMVEVLIAIAVVGILVSVSVSGFLYYKAGKSLDLSVHQVASAIRRAQSKSMAVHGDSVWGVEIAAGQAIVFKGADFNARDVVFDENVSLGGVTSVSGTTRFFFQKMSGIPQNPGNLTLGNENISRTIQINEKGIINIQ